MTARPLVSRSVVAGAGSLVLALTVGSRPAAAHGLGGRADLPLPVWMFSYGAAAVLIVSFTALAIFWPRPRLEDAGGAGVVVLPAAAARVALVAARAVGLVLLVVVIAAAFVGVDLALDNLAPVMVFIVVWVGCQLAAAVVGDVWAAFNPFDTIGAAVERITGPVERDYSLGHWPAAVLFLLWGWYELIYPSRAQPRTLGLVLVVYLVVVVAMVARWGRARLRDAELLTAWFALLAAMAPLHRDAEGRLRLRAPLSGLAQIEAQPGTAALVLVALGVTSFDGVARTQLWFDITGSLDRTALVFVSTVGLLWTTALVAMLYVGALWVASRMTGEDPSELRDAFAHSLIPIAFAYAVAHYFSLLAFEGQGAIAQLSDPFAQGWDLFGTVGHAINYTWLTANQVAWVQFAAILAGHVAGVVWAHDRALARLPGREATRSQIPLLVSMVAFTVGALALLLGG